MLYRVLIVSLVVLVLLGVLLSYGNQVAAQGGPVDWSVPINISNTLTRSHHQYIVADTYGYVHLFWMEDVGGSVIQVDSSLDADQTGVEIEQTQQGDGPGNTIFYRRWDGTSWSETVDLFFTRAGSYSYPTAAVDEEGNLYLLWISTSGVHFSSAPAHTAISAAAWLPDTIIARAQGARPALLARGNGQLDVVYDTTRTEGRVKNGNIYYIRSADGGWSWTVPQQLSLVDVASATIAVWPRLARDGGDRLHLVWHEADPPGYIGTAAYYARSIDGGETWTLPMKVDEVRPGINWANTINIGVIGNDEIHLVWVCGEKPGRCHQWSADGGATWTATERLFGDLHSRANWDALVTDASDNLYWVMQLRYPYALYYTYWSGDGWIDPPLVLNDDPLVQVGHGVQLAVGLGNQLHLVVHHPSIYEIWHIQGVSVLSSSKAPQGTPTAQPTSTSVAVTMAAPDATRQIESLDLPTEEQPPVAFQSPAVGLVSGVMPAAVLIVVAALLKTFRRQRR